MTAMTLDQQGDTVSRSSSGAVATTACAGLGAPRSSPAGRNRLMCRWRYTADGCLRCSWQQTSESDWVSRSNDTCADEVFALDTPAGPIYLPSGPSDHAATRCSGAESRSDAIARWAAIVIPGGGVPRWLRAFGRVSVRTSGA
jgi:hypothetical protein